MEKKPDVSPESIESKKEAEKAVATYNEMRNEQAVAAAFHLTC